MICRLCLSETSDELDIFAKIGEDQKIANVIEQHFWFKIFPDDPISTFVCCDCWFKVADFHQFYVNIQQAHSSHHELLEVKVELTDDYCPNVVATTATASAENYINDPANSLELCRRFEKNLLNPLYEPEVEPLCVSTPGDKDVMQECTSLEEDGKGKCKRRRAPCKRNALPNEGDDQEQGEAGDKPKRKRRCRKTLKQSDNEADEFVLETPEAKVQIPGCQEFFKVSPVGESTETAIKSPPKVSNCEDVDDEIFEDSTPGATKKMTRIFGNLSTVNDDAIIKKHVPLGCDLCTFVGDVFDDIKNHFKEFHSDLRPYVVCCTRKLKGQSMVLQHAYNHENPDYFKCHECQKVFSDGYQLSSHNRAFHAPEEDLRYKCGQCSKKFARRHLLTLHKASHVPVDERKFICTQCPHTNAFASNHLLQIHINMRHKRPTNICHVCAKEIRDKASFEKHVRLHFEDSGPRVKCPYDDCDSWLKDEDNLKQHIKRLHQVGQVYTCSRCGKCCKTRRALDSHVHYTHSGKTYTCEVCSKTFKKAISLKEHMAQHTGESLYKCPFCVRTFNSNANMHSHKKKKHPIEWEVWRRTKRCSAQQIINQQPAKEKLSLVFKNEEDTTTPSTYF